jgi:ATP-dependent Clp protease ATP-binding subunit ClpA
VFELFTDRARRVVVLAQEEARNLDHDYIGTEHLLLGLLVQSDGIAVAALASQGVSREVARERVAEIVGRGKGTRAGHIPFTKRAKNVLEGSLREARTLGDDAIDTQHILLGILDAPDCVACQVVESIGPSLSQIRNAVADAMDAAPRAPSETSVDPAAAEVDVAVGPACAGCEELLEETALHRLIEIRAFSETDGPITMRIAYCGACGRTIGILPRGRGGLAGRLQSGDPSSGGMRTPTSSRWTRRSAGSS